MSSTRFTVFPANSRVCC